MKTRSQTKKEQQMLLLQSQPYEWTSTQEEIEVANILLSMKHTPIPPNPPVHKNSQYTSTVTKTQTKSKVEPYIPSPTPEDVPVHSINFEEASREWMRNKRKLRNGMYQYRCIAITTIGNQCVLVPIKGKKCCYIHRYKEPDV